MHQQLRTRDRGTYGSHGTSLGKSGPISTRSSLVTESEEEKRKKKRASLLKLCG